MVSVTLGVAIGVVFVFLLFSLFLSTALEAVSALLKLRGRALRVAIARLIDDPAHQPKWGGFGLIDKLSRKSASIGKPPTADAPLAADPVDAGQPEVHEAVTESREGEFVAARPLRFDAVFHHPLVAGAQSSGKPSYVSAPNFTSALLHALRPDGASDLVDGVRCGVAALPAGALRDALQTAVEEADGDWDQLKAGVERWYAHAMDRLTGEYKRFSQLATFLAGFAIAAIYNVDAVAIAQRLYVDDNLRGAIEEQAKKYVEAAPAASAASAPASASGAASAVFQAKLDAATQARGQLTRAIAFVESTGGKTPWAYAWNRPAALFGWLLTALAGMLGAPFWFELLQKLVNLRGAGPKPADDTPKTGATP